MNKSPFSQINRIFWFSFDFVLWNQEYFFWKRVTCMFFTVFQYICKFFNFKKVCFLFIGLFCFCFKNIDLLDRKITQFTFSLRTLFVIFISCGLRLSQYVVPIFSPVFISFIFDRAFFMFYIVGSISLIINFKHFDFIEWFDLSVFLFCLLVLLIFCLIFLIVCL